MLAAHLIIAHRLAQQWRKREAAGMFTTEQFGPVNADATECQSRPIAIVMAIVMAIANVLTVKHEIAAWVMRWIVNQHQMSEADGFVRQS